MSPAPPVRRRLFAALVGVVTVVGAAAVALGSFDAAGAARPGAYGALAIAGALLALTGAVFLLVAADRVGSAELGFAGTGVATMTVMLLVNGVAAPEWLFDSTAGFHTAAVFAGPAFAIGALPLLVARSRFARWAGREWRNWSLFSLLGAFVLATGLLAAPDLIEVPHGRHLFTVLLALASAWSIAAVAARFSARAASGVAGFAGAGWALGALAVSALLPIAEDYGAGFWGLRAFAVAGGVGAALAGITVAGAVRQSQQAFAPVLEIDPLAGLDLALSPAVARAVALDALGVEGTDEVTRTAALAIAVARQMRLRTDECRRIGLAAVLHDIGKATLPQAIFDKPGKLTADERDIVQQHTIAGEQIVLADPFLADLAPIVRSHHERCDGAGYPDRLAGADIPIGARVIAACDAFDAMTHDRPYRGALSEGAALAVLREHAGRQWDADVVRALTVVVAGRPERLGAAEQVEFDGELARVPENVGELLALVDSEI